MGKYRRPLTRGGREKFLEEDLIKALKQIYENDASELYDSIDIAIMPRMTAKEIDDAVRNVICRHRTENVTYEFGSAGKEVLLPGTYFASLDVKYTPDGSILDEDDGFGLDIEKIRSCGPDPIAVMTLAVNGMFGIQDFRVTGKNSNPFYKRITQKALELEIFELGIIQGVINKLVRDGILKEVPNSITQMARETRSLVSALGGSGLGAAQGGSGGHVAAQGGSGLGAAASDPGMHAFVFICRGPDPSGMTKILRSIGMTGRGLPEAMRKVGFSGPDRNVHMYTPDWNSKVYSSWQLKQSGEMNDLMTKIRATLKNEGFKYKGEAVKTLQYAEETSYAQMGLFIAYLFIRK